ncbi:hypothetical protein IE53DRAFT_261340 [Violaceomyces palustris]|uniref:Uncharacterized protein n=1 Tax=Violaceomyces palustris TaxID=1673888 RepID=A0ACD0NN45_9BASI|nr:hypothetical protein IE53DRAFT_261340 [Violaceomyces palustris]
MIRVKELLYLLLLIFTSLRRGRGRHQHPSRVGKNCIRSPWRPYSFVGKIGGDQTRRGRIRWIGIFFGYFPSLAPCHSKGLARKVCVGQALKGPGEVTFHHPHRVTHLTLFALGLLW